MARSKPRPTHGASKYRGVYWHKAGKKWQVRATLSLRVSSSRLHSTA